MMSPLVPHAAVAADKPEVVMAESLRGNSRDPGGPSSHAVADHRDFLAAETQHEGFSPPHTVLYSSEIKMFIICNYVVIRHLLPAFQRPGLSGQPLLERRFILLQLRTGSKVAKNAATIQKTDTAVKSLPFS